MLENEMDFLVQDEFEIEEKHIGQWNIMIVDDDSFVHAATKYALAGFSFMQKNIHWIDAFSANEAKELLQNDHDIALMFLDVVMESDDAGLALVKWFREENINPCTRIILRTGQPGQAPERQIILNYDLHDYKTKTELNSDKLFTTTVAALRSFYDMSRLESTRMGLEGIIKVSGELFKIQSMHEYAANVLMQITTILDIPSAGMLCSKPKNSASWNILAQNGTFKNTDSEILSIITSMAEERLEDNQSTMEDSTYLVKLLTHAEDIIYALYLEPIIPLNDIQTKMIYMFCNNISIGLRNINLYHSLLHSHRTTVMSMAKITEYRDHDTGEHIFRMAKGTEMLANALHVKQVYPLETSDIMVSTIGLSSTLHDIGKVATPDNILLKPGKLTSEEFEEMKRHSITGADMLQSTLDFTGESVDYLELGKSIALHHHERWNGEGYPNQISGNAIPIAARITTLIDVFDALQSKRCYKPAFTLEECLDIIKSDRGKLFDPLIVDTFFEILPEFLTLYA